MSPLDAMTSPASHPPAGKFYDSDDDNDDNDSISSGSSSDSDSDDEEEAITPNTTPQASLEEEEDDELKIRQKAFELINKAGGPSEKDRNSKRWPQNPKKLHYTVPQSQQQQQDAAQSSGEMSFAGPYASPYQQSLAGQQQRHPNSPAAHEAEKLSVTSLFINCVSDLCKQSGKEIMQSGASILSSGYQSVSHYRDTPLQGSYDPIDTSQHGYGNGNNGGSMMRGRYRD